MLDEEMDNIIREAAANHHPAYDDKAWDKMNELLDKHLPQDRRRKPFLWLFLMLVMVGIGGYFIYSQFTGNKKDSNSKQQDIAVKSKEQQPGNSLNPSVQNSIQASPDVTTNQSVTSTNIGSFSDPNNPSKQNKTSSGKFDIGKIAAKTAIAVTNPVADADEQADLNKTKSGIISQTDVTTNAVKPEIINEPKKAEEPAKAVLPLEQPDPAQTAVNKAKEEKQNDSKANTSKQKNKHSMLGNFGVSVSAGPDISMVEYKKPGKVTLAYGIGLGYTFMNKLTLQTGFYVAKKVYSSDSSHYHPSGPIAYYPYVDNIDANCKVYEIPVNLLYNFGQHKKHNFYAGAGISSLIMKSEVYDYSYKYYGQYYSQTKTINNENQHNFSQLNLTAGYQYNISNRVSVSAQPYVKLPLKGIGFGKVQLKSGGVMINATVKPFAKKVH